MKTHFLLCLCIFSYISHAQTGSLSIQLNHVTRPLPESLLLSCWHDSIYLGEYRFDSTGIFLCTELPTGFVKLELRAQDSLLWQSNVFVQENQRLSLPLDFGLLTVQHPTAFEINEQGMLSPDAGHAPAASIQYNCGVPLREIQEVTCTTYRMPLLSSGASGSTITREDIQRLPVRSASEIAATVGGVNQSEATGEIYIRGGRSEQTTYYLDGIRMQEPVHLPKVAIDQVQVFSSGIPANYGDASGGIIAIETLGYSSGLPKNSVRRSPPPIIPNVLAYDHFLPVYENEFLAPGFHPHSTFGIDVDRASWSYIKNALQNKLTINRDAVKLEEMINSFQYSSDLDQSKDTIAVEIQRHPCHWNSESELVSIQLKAMDLPKDTPRKPFNLVFLIDVSGSMSSENKLPLLISGLRNFVQTLRADDVVSIVTYAGVSGVPLPATPGAQKERILLALDQLTAIGSTNGIGGITSAYEIAEKNYNPNYNNRIILATDGDFNVGINSTGDLEQFISGKRGQGIYLTALGFGMGNYKNSTLETLADRGDGNHFYISSLADCEQVLSGDIGNLINLARDVKIDVQFNPNLVKEYRLIGYENRLLKTEDFANDGKDGGEMGYGHQVMAVYEIKKGKSAIAENAFVQNSNNSDDTKLAVVKLRYKNLEATQSVEKEFTLINESISRQNDLLNLVISCGLLLRNSDFKNNLTVAQLQKAADKYRPVTAEEEVLVKLIGEMK